MTTTEELPPGRNDAEGAQDEQNDLDEHDHHLLSGVIRAPLGACNDRRQRAGIRSGAVSRRAVTSVPYVSGDRGTGETSETGKNAPMPGPEESTEEILKAARDAGWSTSHDQLVRLHQFGIIQRPRQRPLGRGKGTVTLYPVGTTALVIRATELKRKFDLAEVAWTMWWEGLAVSDSLARSYLTKAAKSFIKQWGELVDEQGDLTAKAHDFLDRAGAPETRIDSMPMRWARRRVGTDNFDPFLTLLLAVVAGRTADLPLEDLELIERGMGIDRARTDVLATTGNPWLDGDIREDFENIRRLANPADIATALTEASDEELRELRDKTKLFCSFVSNMGSVVRQTIDRWAFGFGGFGAFFDDMLKGPAGQALVLLLVVRVVQAGFAPGLDQNVSNAPGAEQTRRIQDAVIALREAVPEVADAVPLRWFGKAMSDVSYTARIQERIAELRQDDEVRTKIDAFFEAHPEYRVSE